ncbi:class I SAM-dependent methyltransferase [Oceanobacillus halophilus]|uniref:Class I SAM-dependent methyltransferase n=1 Tax=Oceanobacillus halophilus TaxID=930130 RepID=A0A494ZS32_9BACI|nr:class I SAM-dependent methyltransferase [Oceanobacillus halophilus]RKQ28440.1 class I SAM-dependent methyltransferase [Oceanobacillus halophilus]
MIEKTKDNWNPKLYDEKHSFVSKFGRDLIELLNPKEEERILDLGCGTGDLTKELTSYDTEVIGVDKSEKMIQKAKEKYPDIPFHVQDATSLKFEREFDAVFTNATLHWVKPPEQALQQIYQVLKKGGRFVAEFGGKGNVQIITNEINFQIKENGINYKPENFPWYFPSIGEYTKLMEEIGFSVTFAYHFDRPTLLDGEDGLRNWLEMFGNSLLHGIDEDRKHSILWKAENRLKESLYHSGDWIADYKRIRVVGIKD